MKNLTPRRVRSSATRLRRRSRMMTTAIRKAEALAARAYRELPEQESPTGKPASRRASHVAAMRARLAAVLGALDRLEKAAAEVEVTPKRSNPRKSRPKKGKMPPGLAAWHAKQKRARAGKAKRRR